MRCATTESPSSSNGRARFKALNDHPLSPVAIRGVLCFTRAELPWLRPAPGGIALLSPRGLSRTLRRPGTLSPQQVHHLATLLAHRLPVA